MSRALVFILALFFSAAAMAETVPASGPGQMGRVAAVSGAVTIQAAGDAQPSEPAVNTPLTTGSRLVTAPHAEAIVDIAAGRFYLDGDSAITVGTLSPGTASVAVEKGDVILHILPGGSGQVFTIQTPHGALRADQPGYFKVAVSEAVAAQDDFLRRVIAEVEAAGEDKLAAPKYVSPQTTGFQELQRYGLWVMTEKYGPVWEPTVASDWAPFRNGHWAEIAPWGRTWIDNAPWGFAPAHYGQWTQVNRRWVWVPGNTAGAPAASAFDTAGQNAAGWVALGPEEPYFTPAPVIVNTMRVTRQPEPPKVVNVTTVNNTTNVTTIVRQQSAPAVVLFGSPVPSPPSPPPSVSSPSANVTGLGAAGTPIGSGVRFPGQ